MQNTFNKLEELSATLKTMLPMKPEFQKILDEKFRLEFNYNSNHIEGNTLTYGETKLLLIFDKTKGDHDLREYEEMQAHDVAFKLVKEWAVDKERSITEKDIKNLNEVILVKPFWKDAVTLDGQSTRRQIKIGDYKEFPNSVVLSNGEIFDYASVTDTPILMGELKQWFSDEEKKNELHPIVLAALLHYKFVSIHPFDDGNGRISRLLMNYVLLKNELPPIVIKSNDKKNYLLALNKADAGELDAFVKYIAEQLIWSFEISIRAAKGEDINEIGDLDKKIKSLKQKLNSSNEVVKIKKSNRAILDILGSNIEPLLRRISKKLSEFDNLFKSKTEYLVSGGKLGENLEKSLIAFKTSLKFNSYENITYVCVFSKFRKGAVTSKVGCELEFEFHENVYEILLSYNSLPNIDKLYDENLTEEEEDLIIEALGTYVYNQIEKALEY